MKLIPHNTKVIACGLVLAGSLLTTTVLQAYESYHAPAPAPDDTGYCATCHGDFRASGGLHDLHTSNPDGITSDCALCHTGSGRDNPLIMWSDYDSGNGLGCTGCHGRDYGETVAADYRDFTITGKQKNSGYGLRKHHRVNGIASCLGCHPDPNEPTTQVPYPENVIDPGLGNTVHYYKLSGTVELGNADVDPSINEDTANDADSEGLDNDGDNLYDMNDPDSVLNPGSPMITQLPSGGLRLQWPTPSPGWELQETLDLNVPLWVVPGTAQRVNGFWFVDIEPPLLSRQFYRLETTP